MQLVMPVLFILNEEEEEEEEGKGRKEKGESSIIRSFFWLLPSARPQ